MQNDGTSIGDRARYVIKYINKNKNKIPECMVQYRSNTVWFI